MVAHPVCKRLANSGVRWLDTPPPRRTVGEMSAELEAGARFYRHLRDAPVRFKAIENPIMHRRARELTKVGPRHVVQPWWFGDPQFKATGFELFNLPPLLATNKLTPPARGSDEHKHWSRVHRMPPGPNREKERSRFFPGMAAAMAAQWGAWVCAELKKEQQNDDAT